MQQTPSADDVQKDRHIPSMESYSEDSIRRSRTQAYKQVLTVSAICALVIGAWVASVFLFIKPAFDQSGTEPRQKENRKSLFADTHTVTSTAGFSFQYDANALEVNGQTIESKTPEGVISGKEYTDPKELETPRPYSVVMIELPFDGTSETYLHMPRMSIVASTHLEKLKDFAVLPENQGLTDIDLFAKYMIAKDLERNKRIKLSDEPRDITINGVSYKKAVFVQAELSEKSFDEVYYTVQHDQGFIVGINNIEKDNQYKLPVFRAVLKTIHFAKHQ